MQGAHNQIIHNQTKDVSGGGQSFSHIISPPRSEESKFTNRRSPTALFEEEDDGG
jgi:hypothetical protein